MAKSSIPHQRKSVSCSKERTVTRSPKCENHHCKEIQTRLSALEVTQREILKFVRSRAGDSLVPLKEVGERLGKINVKTVQRMLDKGRLGWVPTGAADQKPQRMVPESEIQRYIATNAVPADATNAERKIEEDFDAK